MSGRMPKEECFHKSTVILNKEIMEILHDLID